MKSRRFTFNSTEMQNATNPEVKGLRAKKRASICVPGEDGILAANEKQLLYDALRDLGFIDPKSKSSEIIFFKNSAEYKQVVDDDDDKKLINFKKFLKRLYYSDASDTEFNDIFDNLVASYSQQTFTTFLNATTRAMEEARNKFIFSKKGNSETVTGDTKKSIVMIDNHLYVFAMLTHLRVKETEYDRFNNETVTSYLISGAIFSAFKQTDPPGFQCMWVEPSNDLLQKLCFEENVDIKQENIKKRIEKPSPLLNYFEQENVKGLLKKVELDRLLLSIPSGDFKKDIVDPLVPLIEEALKHNELEAAVEYIIASTLDHLFEADGTIKYEIYKKLLELNNNSELANQLLLGYGNLILQGILQNSKFRNEDPHLISEQFAKSLAHITENKTTSPKHKTYLIYEKLWEASENEKFKSKTLQRTITNFLNDDFGFANYADIDLHQARESLIEASNNKNILSNQGTETLEAAAEVQTKTPVEQLRLAKALKTSANVINNNTKQNIEACRKRGAALANRYGWKLLGSALLGLTGLAAIAGCVALAVITCGASIPLTILGATIAGKLLLGSTIGLGALGVAGASVGTYKTVKNGSGFFTPTPEGTLRDKIEDLTDTATAANKLQNK